MESEISVLQVEKRIRTRVKRQMEKTQREYYLNVRPEARVAAPTFGLGAKGEPIARGATLQDG
jgi:hypothetical protein